MSDIHPTRQALLHRLLEGPGHASRALRAAALHDARAELPEPARALAEKVVARAPDVRDEDIAAVRAAGLSEDEIFELVVCLAVGQATRAHDAALAALDAASSKV